MNVHLLIRTHLSKGETVVRPRKKIIIWAVLILSTHAIASFAIPIVTQRVTVVLFQYIVIVVKMERSFGVQMESFAQMGMKIKVHSLLISR